MFCFHHHHHYHINIKTRPATCFSQLKAFSIQHEIIHCKLNLKINQRDLCLPIRCLCVYFYLQCGFVATKLGLLHLNVFFTFDRWMSPLSVSPTPRIFLVFNLECKSPLLCFLRVKYKCSNVNLIRNKCRRRKRKMVGRK